MEDNGATLNAGPREEVEIGEDDFLEIKLAEGGDGVVLTVEVSNH